MPAKILRPRPGPRVKGAGGLELATYHLGGGGEPVILLHATGFHGRCWVPLAPALTPYFSVWSIDQRGHGSSAKAEDGRYDDWGAFVEDLFAVTDALGGGEWRGIGHSLGGAVLLMAEAQRPGTFTYLSVYEPVVIPPKPVAVEVGFQDTPGVSLADLARKRRSRFASQEAAYQNYASKPPFSGFHPDALRAYVEYGLVDTPDGEVTLACVREEEASVFEGAQHAGAWDALPLVGAPVTVLGGGAEPVDPLGRLIDRVARRLPRGGAHRFDDLNHFGPLQDPVGVGQVMAGGLGGSTIDVPPPR